MNHQNNKNLIIYIPMKALILSAGFGTRLRPLTKMVPKALIPICNEPIIDHTVRYLMGNGISEIGVNAHHHHNQMVHHIQSLQKQGVDIHIRVEKDILGTGGGIKNFADFLKDETFIVINADIITDMPLKDVLMKHRKSGALVTLVLTRNQRFNQVLIGSDYRIINILDSPVPDGWTFTGIHVIEPEIFNLMPRKDSFEIIPFYRTLIENGIHIGAYTFKNYNWFDIGTKESYLEVNGFLLGRKKLIAGRGSFIDPSATIEGWAVIGSNCKVEGGSTISRSVLWDNVIVKRGSYIHNSVISSGMVVEGEIQDTAY